MLAAVLALLQAAILPSSPQPHEPTGCGSNIVSATVVATLCGHREGDAEILDLLILWRGRPGWFQRPIPGSTGSRGSTVLPADAGLNGRVSQYTTYGDVSIGFEADFDARVATIDRKTLPLADANAVLIDKVDEPAARHIVSRRRVPSRLALAGDMNVSAIRGSRTLVTFLQCGIPMPARRDARGQIAHVPRVLTVCEKVKQ